MITQRVPETDCTILGQAHAAAYDRMQEALRENGWLETGDLLHSGLVSGRALEVGSGPGYLGFEWLQRTTDTRLVGLDKSPDMVAIARRHAQELRFDERAKHLLGFAEAMPFAKGTFDSVFSSRSLHEWIDPGTIFTELWRVLKPGGRFYVSDLRRDLSSSTRNFLEQRMTSKVVLEGLHASIGAAYTLAEATALLGETELVGYEVVETPIGLRVTGVKPG
jgi:ubiquinone/menaquinone biosynthesis C-methylase UbiE